MKKIVAWGGQVEPAGHCSSPVPPPPRPHAPDELGFDLLTRKTCVLWEGTSQDLRRTRWCENLPRRRSGATLHQDRSVAREPRSRRPVSPDFGDMMPSARRQHCRILSS